MKNNFVVFDLGGSSIKYTINNVNKILTFKVKNISKKIVLNFITKIANENCAENIYISAPGLINPKNGKISGLSAIKNWKSQNIYKELLLNLKNKKTKISIENDANCALLGAIYDYKKKINFAVAIVIGTGIGGSYYNGIIQRGWSNAMCEFGMMKIAYDNNQTVSSKLSINALCHHVNEKLATNYDGFEIFQEYEKKNLEIIKITNQWFLEITNFIYNVIWIFDPQLLFIGGAVGENLIFQSKIVSLVDKLFSKIKVKRKVKIEFAKKGNFINILGAKLL